MPSQSAPPFVIHWFRRDLRLADNTALAAATRDSGGHVLPLYIQSAWRGTHRWTGAGRQEFLSGALKALAVDLERAGSRLITRRGEALEELERLVLETGAQAIYYNRDPDPFGRRVEQRLQPLAQRLGIEAHGFNDVTALPPDAVLTGAGQPYRVFTPFSKAWLRYWKAHPPEAQEAVRSVRPALQQPASRVRSLPLPTLGDWGLASTKRLLASGETAARRRLESFFEGPVYFYKEKRDFPAEEGTSRFSADLRWGVLSIREVIARCTQAIRAGRTPSQRQSASAFLNELIWREFSMAVLWHWPEVLEEEFQEQYRGMPWLWPGRSVPQGVLRSSAVNPEEAFERWKEGATGFPIVDAGMRQLRETGFMHNRVRMIVAMFLTKDLHLDWRLGEQFFMQQLVDGEIASNNGGWQWCAGTGADAAPYFRIQNPWRQTASFDPEGAYIKRWVPELRGVDGRRFLKPPPPGERLAPGYSRPIVDHAQERLITLEVFKSQRAKP